MMGKETIMRNIFKEQEKDVSEHKRKYEETQKERDGTKLMFSCYGPVRKIFLHDAMT